MTVVTVVWSMACILFAPFPYAKRYYLTSRWNVIVIWAARVICGIRYQVKGMENLPDAPVILLSKHQSAWETIFYLIIMPRPLVVVQGRKRLADGQWVIMFPEGTRIPVGQVGKYKHGGSRLAVETNTQVVPIAVNAGECWPKGSFIKKPGIITVSIGKPISPEGLDPAQLSQRVENWIESEMRVISPAVYAAVDKIKV